MACWFCPRSGVSAFTGPARLRARPRPSRSPTRPTGGMWRSPVRRCLFIPSRPPDRRPAIDLGLESFATLADGRTASSPPATTARRKPICAAASDASPGVRRAATADAKPSRCWPKRISTLRRQRRDFHHQQARKLVQAYDVIYHEDLRVANMVQNHHLAKSIQDAGWRRS